MKHQPDKDYCTHLGTCDVSSLIVVLASECSVKIMDCNPKGAQVLSKLSQLFDEPFVAWLTEREEKVFSLSSFFLISSKLNSSLFGYFRTA